MMFYIIHKIKFLRKKCMNKIWCLKAAFYDFINKTYIDKIYIDEHKSY